ncbi:hypothetical protein [Flavobacterium sp.]|uniref:hypothetical protein n=1 Tax=Flavobacterium sp. TaxID=239 RepID=UPI0025FA68DD|nr:hypothetical protein [Flavobacterium sp.]
MEKTIKGLKTIGFIKVGNWKLNQDSKIYFDIEAEYLNIENLLYAFVEDKTVRYIGITEKSLKSRMINYKNGYEESKTSGITNKKVNKSIKNLLICKKEVCIYILKKDADCDFFGLTISLATGIEKSLIKAFDFNNNLWNSRGTITGGSKSKQIDIKVSSYLEINQSVLKLGKEAYNKGVIIFKNDLDYLLPLESDDMDIIYKNKVFPGYFTRSFSNKKTNGYLELKKIFRDDFKINDLILVTLLSTNEVKIEKYV